MRMKYLMGFYTCEPGDTSASQRQNVHDIRMDEHEAFISFGVSAGSSLRAV